MDYYFKKELDCGFEEALERTEAALKTEGFGVLTEIDVRATLKKKLDVDFPNYKILGACNPPFAHKALTAEERIGLMLPCNTVVRETKDGKIEVAMVDPIASMRAVENAQLGELAGEVKEGLKRALDKI